MIDRLLAIGPFSLPRDAREATLRQGVGALTRHHFAACPPYRNILANLRFDPTTDHPIEDYPFLPARMFKSHDLSSVPVTAVRKVLTSSGTSGQQPSRIALDAATAADQAKVLTRIVGDFIGKARRPMLILDAPSTVKDRSRFSARAAGILGFTMFGRDVTFALTDDMEIDDAAVGAFCDRHGGGDVLLFGFTFVIHQYVIDALRRKGARLLLPGGTLIHGGGWKKLADRAISNDAFKASLAEVTGITRVHNYYGLVEQAGSIFMECEHGNLHCSVFSDVIMRDSRLEPLPVGARGLTQLVSLLPRSYPGHVLLTEDEGTIAGIDDCPCGRLGKYFHIHGRAAKAEIRGCSDTFADD